MKKTIDFTVQVTRGIRTMMDAFIAEARGPVARKETNTMSIRLTVEHCHCPRATRHAWYDKRPDFFDSGRRIVEHGYLQL